VGAAEPRESRAVDSRQLTDDGGQMLDARYLILEGRRRGRNLYLTWFGPVRIIVGEDEGQ
jgi:ribosomal protein S28E/S33